MNSFFSNNHFKDIEDSIKISGRYFDEVVYELLKNICNNQICLDIGCGSGFHFENLAKNKFIEMIGVDAKNDFTNFALKRGYNRIVNINDLNFSNLDFENESIDIVVCKDVMEHLHNPIFLIKEVKRVLKKNGIFLIHVPNHFPIYGRLKFLIKNNLNTFNYFNEDDRLDYPHVRFYKHSNLLSRLIDFDFTLKKDLSYIFPALPGVNRSKILKYFYTLLAKKFPENFAASITLLLEKNNV